jgi:hypothetical protein
MSDGQNCSTIKPQRLYFIDMARMLALWYMFFQHGELEVLTLRHSKIITLIADFVPICSALFLYTAGFAAVLSQKSNIRQNVISRLKKGIFLIIASSILFSIECGFRLPDMIIASGILNTIGIFTISTIILSWTPKKFNVLIWSLWTTFLAALFIVFDINRIYIFPFTNAYECIIPTIIYGYIGLTCGLIYQQTAHHKLFHITSIIVGLVGLIIMTSIFGLHHCFDYTHGRYTVIRSFGADKLMVWNFNSVSFIASLAAVLLISGLCGLCENFFCSLQEKKPMLADKILLPGQHALINYFYHLAVWAIIVVTLGFNALPQWAFLTVLVGLIITSYPIGYIGKKIKNGLRHF